MAAVTQIGHRHSQGRAYSDKKLAGGKTPKEALRALKRQISNAIIACLQADARRAKDPGGQPLDTKRLSFRTSTRACQDDPRPARIWLIGAVVDARSCRTARHFHRG
jgi:hypothetical protein